YFSSGTLALKVYKGGQLLTYGSGYTLSGQTLTVASLSGETVTIAYWSEYEQSATKAGVEALALSLYNKIANSRGGYGVYYDLHETSGNRLDQANGTIAMAPQGTVGTANGPRGAGDICLDCGSGIGYLKSATNTNSNNFS